ncbi:MAG: hypothetical protein IPK82_31875 [Polyangiaceae bacterium]|nr:hypothetical protein [Polyangiaceae bacterium]
MKRLRGMKSLVTDAVDKGSQAVERVQIETAKIPFDLLEKVPGIKVPASGVRRIYNMSVSNVHSMIRLVNHVAGETFDAMVDSVQSGLGTAAAPPAETPKAKTGDEAAKEPAKKAK